MVGMACAMHGRHFDEGARTAWQKLNFVTYSFFNPHFVPIQPKLQSCITTTPLSNALCRACGASATKYYDKTVVL